MKGIAILCLVLAGCLAAGAAGAATAIVIDTANAYSSNREVTDTLPPGQKVEPVRADKDWVLVKYSKEREETIRQGWVERSKLEEIPEGFDSRVSEHCILHAQEPNYAERFDLKVTEEFYNAVARSLVNGKEEPPFNPNVKLRIYLLNRETYLDAAKRRGEPTDGVGFRPALGSVYLEYSLRATTPPMSGLIVHEFAMLVLRDYANQPPGRATAGAPLPLWIIEAFAMYHEYLAGFNTDDLTHVADKPKLSTITNRTSVPTKEEDRIEYLATAGTLGHMLLNYGSSERFSGLVRVLQATAGRGESPSVTMLKYYGNMTKIKFQTEWARYVSELKEKYGIKKREEEIKDQEEDEGDGLFSPSSGNWIDNYLKGFLPGKSNRAVRRSFISRLRSALAEKLKP